MLLRTVHCLPTLGCFFSAAITSGAVGSILDSTVPARRFADRQAVWTDFAACLLGEIAEHQIRRQLLRLRVCPVQHVLNLFTGGFVDHLPHYLSLGAQLRQSNQQPHHMRKEIRP